MNVTLFALLAGVGVFLFVEALGSRPVRVQLAEADQRPFAQRMTDMFFTPVTRRIMGIGGRVDLDEKRKTLALRLARAGYPPPLTTPDAVLGYKLLTSILFVAFGGAFVVMSGWGQIALPLILGMAVFGWTLPDKILADAEKERIEQLTLDAASTLDRLAIYVAAGNALPAAVRSLSERPGGAWVAVFRGIAADYAVNGEFPEALSRAAEGSGRLPEILGSPSGFAPPTRWGWRCGPGVAQDGGRCPHPDPAGDHRARVQERRVDGRASLSGHHRYHRHPHSPRCGADDIHGVRYEEGIWTILEQNVNRKD